MTSSSSKKNRSAAKSAKAPPATSGSPIRWVAVGILIVVVIYGAYRVMSPSRGSAPEATRATSTGATAPGQPAGGRVTGPEVIGTAQIADGVQRISIDVSTGVYKPNVIELKTGIPAELTFSQSQGCTGAVHSQELGFSEDLTAGPKTVKLKGLPPGTYQFSCGMNMVFGQVVVR